MSASLRQADAIGELKLANESAPMPYQVSLGAEKQDGNYIVKLSAMVPRDWLLKRGFEVSATLVRQDGSAIELSHEGVLNVSDAVAVELSTVDTSCSNEAELQRKYPELPA